MKHQKNRTLQTTSSRHKQTNHNDLTQLKDGNWLVCRVDKRQSLFSDDKSSLKWDYSRRSIYTIHYLNNRQILLLCFCHLIHRKGCKKKKRKKNSTTNWRIKDKFDIWCFIPGIFFNYESNFFKKWPLFGQFWNRIQFSAILIPVFPVLLH